MKKPLTITNISDFIFIKLDFIIMFEYQCVKSVRIRNFSGPHFPAFGPAKTPNTNTFHAVNVLKLVKSNS